MRFEEVLEDYVIDDWSAYYVQFLRLKEQLTRVDPSTIKKNSFFLNDRIR